MSAVVIEGSVDVAEEALVALGLRPQRVTMSIVNDAI